MGMYDIIWGKTKDGEDLELQFKNASQQGLTYEIGDKIDTADGVHFCWEGCFVVFSGIIVAAFAEKDEMLHNTWGEKVPFPDLQP